MNILDPTERRVEKQEERRGLSECFFSDTVREQEIQRRAIAQLASALAWGARGRGFKSH
jgi:hypothetical protein